MLSTAGKSGAKRCPVTTCHSSSPRPLFQSLTEMTLYAIDADLRKDSAISPGARRATLVLAFLLMLGPWTAGVRANGGPRSYVVDSLGDTGAGSGTTGDLRYCLTQSLYTDAVITFSVTGTIALSGGPLVISGTATINGPGAHRLTIDAQHGSRVFSISPNSTVAISSLSLINGRAMGAGTAGGGGGILNDRATLTIRDCTLSGNEAAGGGGAIHNLAETGGAALTVISSTMSGNIAGGSGGAILSGGAGSATLTIVNSTLSGNAAGHRGGGISNEGALGTATLTVLNCTLSGNTAIAGGGITTDNAAGNGTLTIENTIFARGTTGPNYSGLASTVISSRGRNLSDDQSASAFAARVLSLPLGPLADNGGPTKTHALVPGNPAIDAGDNSILAQFPANAGPEQSLLNDQRGPGYPRLLAGTSGVALVDIGAFELDLGAGNDLTFTTDRKAIEINVLANDAAGTPAPTVTIVRPPAHGSVTVLSGGSVRYVPRVSLPPEGDSFTYRFTDALDRVRSAAVIVANFRAFDGESDGLIAAEPTAPNERIGYLRCRVSGPGRFSAVVTLGGRQFITGATSVNGVRRHTFAITGKLDESGHHRRILKREPQEPLTLDFQLDPITRGVIGTVASIDENGTPFVSTFTASSRTRADAFAGTFTMLVEPPPGPSTGPSHGVGFATVKVGAAGDVRITGRLADGSPFTSGTLLHVRDFAVHSVLYPSGSAPRGSLSGLLRRGTGALSKATGPLRWLKPPRPDDTLFPTGIDLTANATANRYRQPAFRSNALQSNLPPATADLRVARWTLATLAAETATIDSLSRVTILSANPLGLRLRLDESTGLLTGSFTHPATGKATALRGIALQGEERAAGFFLDANARDSGAVSILTGR